MMFIIAFEWNKKYITFIKEPNAFFLLSDKLHHIGTTPHPYYIL